MSTPAWGEEVARRLSALKKQQEEEEGKEGEEEYIPEDEDEASDDESEYDEEESNSEGSGSGGRRGKGRRASAGRRSNRGKGGKGGAGGIYVVEEEEEKDWMMGPDGVRRRRKQLTQKWTQEEDSLLTELVLQHGQRDWGLVASHMPGTHRKGKQCRERWRNQLDPNIKRCVSACTWVLVVFLSLSLLNFLFVLPHLLVLRVGLLSPQTQFSSLSSFRTPFFPPSFLSPQRQGPLDGGGGTNAD